MNAELLVFIACVTVAMAVLTLEDSGLIASEWVEGPIPRWREYWITMAGQQAADAAIRKADPNA